jgi:hypothetical protein
MAVAPFVLGMRSGATPILGATLRTHYIADTESMGSICGHSTPFGWAAGGPNILSTDLGQVTCGACLAALTHHFPGA